MAGRLALGWYTPRMTFFQRIRREPVLIAFLGTAVAQAVVDEFARDGVTWASLGRAVGLAALGAVTRRFTTPASEVFEFDLADLLDLEEI